MEFKFPRVNTMTVSARLTRDGELRYLPSGAAVFHCGVAIDDGYWDKQANQWVSQTIFIEMDVWGIQGEKLSKTLRKGSPIIVEGRLKQRAYTTPEGQNRRITEIHAERVHSLESNRTEGSSYDDGDNTSQQASYNQESDNNKAQTKRPEPDFINDDVPF